MLVLIGGGEFSFGETREIDEFLVRHLQKKTIAFLPTASGSAEYAVHLGKYFQDLDSEISLINVPIYRGRDVRRARSLIQIREAGMVYVGGGVTNRLLSTIRATPAEEAMREAAANGAIVAAIGAAAASFGTHARDMHSPAAALPALGWLDRTVIEQDETMLRRLMSLPDVDLGISLPPKTALAIDAAGNATLLGASSVAVVRKP